MADFCMCTSPPKNRICRGCGYDPRPQHAHHATAQRLERIEERLRRVERMAGRHELLNMRFN